MEQEMINLMDLEKEERLMTIYDILSNAIDNDDTEEMNDMLVQLKRLEDKDIKDYMIIELLKKIV